MCCILPSCVCMCAFDWNAARHTCSWICAFKPRYIYTQPLAGLFITPEPQLESGARKLVYMQKYISVMGSETMAGFESDQNILRCSNKAVIESDVTCAEVEMFSLTLSSPLQHTGQERQQSAAVILVMISLRRAIASHALFNKGAFEVLRSIPRLSFHMLPVHCKWNQNEGKEIKGKHLFFSWALQSFYP